MKVISTARNFNIADCNAINIIKDAGHDFVDYGDYAFKSDNERLEMIKDADVIITAVEEMQADFLSQCPNLKAVAVRGIGYDNVDAEYCKRNNIAILRAVGTLESSVAEMVIAYIMYFARRVDLQSEYMHRGEWNRIMMQGAKKKVLGLVGFGAIGKEIAIRANALGMEIKYFCRNPKDEWNAQYNAEYMPLDELLCISDYVSINVPLTSETRGLVSKEFIAKMKKDSYLINISRGAVADYNAMKDAINNGHLAGGAVDVYEVEPCTDCVLRGVDNVILTPHTSPFTKETFVTMNERTAQNVVDFANDNIDSKYIIK